MVDAPEQPVEKQTERKNQGTRDRSQQQRQNGRAKPYPYAREESAARQRKEEMEARQRFRERKEKERQAMIKARRPDQFGRRRLGRESKVLLDRVKRIVEES